MLLYAPHDYLLPWVYLDHHSMIDHHFIDDPEPPHHIRYKLVFSKDSHDTISLPAPTSFDSHAGNGYTITPLDTTVYQSTLAATED